MDIFTVRVIFIATSNFIITLTISVKSDSIKSYYFSFIFLLLKVLLLSKKANFYSYSYNYNFYSSRIHWAYWDPCSTKQNLTSIKI